MRTQVLKKTNFLLKFYDLGVAIIWLWVVFWLKLFLSHLSLIPWLFPSKCRNNVIFLLLLCRIFFVCNLKNPCMSYFLLFSYSSFMFWFLQSLLWTIQGYFLCTVWGIHEGLFSFFQGDLKLAICWKSVCFSNQFPWHLYFKKQIICVWVLFLDSSSVVSLGLFLLYSTNTLFWLW
jgi:hypothetical protein